MLVEQLVGCRWNKRSDAVEYAPRVDDRRVLSGIIFINRNGLRWCDAPREYGPPKTLYNRWKRWGDMGVFARMMEGLASESTERKTVMM